MKRIITSLLVTGSLLCIPFSFTSCDKLKDAIPPIEFGLNVKDIPMTLPPAPAGQQKQTATFDFDLAAEINKQNTSGYNIGMANMVRARVKEVTILIVGGASQSNNFANFTDAALTLFSNYGTVTGKSSQLLALNIPDVYSDKLEVKVGGTDDLQDYLKGTTWEYSYSYNLRRALTSPLQIIIRVTYTLEMKV